MAEKPLNELQILQNQIKQLAQDLGTINLELNKFLEQNDRLVKQNETMKQRITKKKHIIDQQNKDKMIIHSKLIQAQRKKQHLQIQLQKSKQAQQISTISQKSKQLKEKPKIVESTSSKLQAVKAKIQKQIQLSTLTERQDKYENSDKGQYQPPLLFANDKQQSQLDEEDDQNDEQILKKIRENFQTDKGADD